MSSRPPLWTALLVGLALAELLGAASASAQPIDPFRVAVFAPDPPLYLDPTLAEEQARTPGLSYPRILHELERTLDGDPRFLRLSPEELVYVEGPDSLEGRSRRVGDQALQSGIDYFGRYQLDSAIDQIQDAIDLYYGDSDSYLTHPGQVARAHEYMARTFIERATTSPGERPTVVWMSQAREHFRDMIRLDPDAEIRAGLFPTAVVDLYLEAYLEVLDNEAAGLSLSDRSAQRLAERYDLDRVVWAFFVRDASGGRLVVEVYSAAGQRRFREVLPLADSTGDAVEQASRVASRYLACVPVRYEPPPPSPPGDTGRLFVQAGWGAGVYGEKPTDEPFLNQGVGFTFDYHLTDNFGLFGRANVMFGGRDPDGDLLSGFTSTRLSGGVVLSARADWFRPFLGIGMEINVVGGFTASDNFWCKVSGGEPRVFGPGSACFAGDVREQGSRALAGPYLMPGASFDIVSPFAVYILGSFAFYVSDSSSNLDFPLVGEAGIEYRF